MWFRLVLWYVFAILLLWILKWNERVKFLHHNTSSNAADSQFRIQQHFVYYNFQWIDLPRMWVVMLSFRTIVKRQMEQNYGLHNIQYMVSYQSICIFGLNTVHKSNDSINHDLLLRLKLYVLDSIIHFVILSSIKNG